MYPDDYYNFENDKFVRFFSSPYDPLNNWSAHQVKLWGKTFPTAEHAYHYKKFDMTDMSIALKVFNAPSPWAAHQLAQTYKAEVRDDWANLKLNIMKEILVAKADQNEDVRERLHQTGQREIISNSPWDTFWGCGEKGKGDNHLGKIWMVIRGQQQPLLTPKLK